MQLCMPDTILNAHLGTCNTFTHKVFQERKVVLAHTILLNQGACPEGQASSQQAIQLIAATGHEHTSMQTRTRTRIYAWD